MIRTIYLLAIVMICFNACTQTETTESSSKATKEIPEAKPEVEVKIVEVEGGWGYDIYMNNKRYIHQPNIPGVPGLKVFLTKEEAQKTANLAIQKIEMGIMPPSVTPAELDSLGIRY
jgi:hypothetical protein